MKKKLNTLQAGRGIAAFMVLLYHANGAYGFGGRGHLGHIFSFGFAGVDFFFVLSGFIIAYTSLPFIKAQNGAAIFLRKRILRIYPIYWVYLFVAVIIGYLQYHDLNIFEHFWKTLTFFPGYHFVLRASWTLGFEVFFYLLFALLIFSKWSLFVIIPIGILSAVNAVLQNVGIYYMTDNHIINTLCTPFNIEFLLGYLSYLIYEKINKPIIWILLIATALTIVFEIFYYTRADYRLYPGMRILPFGLPAFVVVTAFAALDYKGLFHAPRFLVVLGDASYTLYLVHANIFSFVNDAIFAPLKLSEKAVMDLMVIVVLFTIGISLVLYKYVEKPLLRKLNKIIPEKIGHDQIPN